MDCGYVHLDPRPSPKDLASFYRRTYYQVEHPVQHAKEQREWWYWRRVYADRMRYAASQLSYRPGKTYCVMDVGAGHGQFLVAARETMKRIGLAPWLFWAVEPNRSAQVALRLADLTVFDYIPVMETRVDVVHCSLVLEHVHNPLQTLKQIHRMMNPGAILCVVVPNEFNVLQNRMAARFGYTPIHWEHVNYFAKTTICQLVRKAGFERMVIEATFPMEWFALHTPLNYVRHPWTGTVAHWLRMAFEIVMRKTGRWDKLSKRWGWYGIGREIVVWGRKR
jgi:SAM-dependent methyltransferase